MTTNIGDFLARRAFRNPTVEAVVEPHSGKRLTFSELNSRINQVCHALDDLGVKPGDRVGSLLMNGIPLIETIFANAKLGSVNVALNWRLTADELEFILKDSGTTALVFGHEFIETVKELHARKSALNIVNWIQVGGEPVDFATSYCAVSESQQAKEPALSCGDNDLLFIMYTSGTTGKPKGVMHSHSTVAWACITQRASLPFENEERMLVSLPLFHVGALTPLFTNMYYGFTSVIIRSFDPNECWQIIQDEKVTGTLLVPAMLMAMKAVFDPNKYDASLLRSVVSGAAPVPVALIEAYQKLGITINQVYGMTESCGPGCIIIGDDAIQRPGSTGRPYFHTEVRIVGSDGNDCAFGEPGELWMRAPNNMLGYWNRPDATAEAMVDGWILSGDVAVMDAEGFVTIVERVKDMLISGGENVYPAEIENVLLGHEGVADAAVIGIPSEKWGESAMAIIVKKDPELQEQDVIQYTKGKLAAFKSIKVVQFTDVIPRNPSGKILKRELREQYAEVVAAD